MIRAVASSETAMLLSMIVSIRIRSLSSFPIGEFSDAIISALRYSKVRQSASQPNHLLVDSSKGHGPVFCDSWGHGSGDVPDGFLWVVSASDVGYRCKYDACCFCFGCHSSTC